MEDVRIVLCDSSPAKRAKLEWNSTQTNVGNTSDGKIRYQSNLIQCLSNGSECSEAVNKETCSYLTDAQNPSSCNFVDEPRKKNLRSDEVFSATRNEGVSSSSDGLLDDDLNLYNQDITTVPDSSNELCSNHDEDDDDFDEVASTISNLSGLSDLSDISGLDWKPIAGPFLWVQRQMELGSNPRNLLQELVPVGTVIPDHLDDVTLWKIICNILSEPPRRNKLSHVNTLDDVVELLKVSKKIIVLTGAGVSVSSGIPDFRSRDGIYARLAKDFPDLPDPQAMFDIHYFRKDPRPFFKFAREIYPGQFEPSLSHKFIKLLEDHGKLLRNYSQNIDTLEQIAGIQKVVQCHGSFATASCTKCGFKVTASHIKNDVFEQNIPKCPKCVTTDPPDDELAVMKPDIVFFGEGLPEEFHSTMAEDKDDCDLLIVVGSSLKVRPVALIPFSIPENVPQILINREPLKHVTFDVELLGDCDVIVNEICLRLKEGWQQIAKFPKLKEDNIDINNTSPTNDGETSKITSRRISTGGVCDSTSDNNNSASSSSSDLVFVTSSEDDGNDPDSTFNVKKNFSTELINVPDGGYLFSSPNCYIFSGAEVSIVTSSENEENHSCGSGEDSGVGDLRPSCDVRTVMTSREYF